MTTPTSSLSAKRIKRTQRWKRLISLFLACSGTAWLITALMVNFAIARNAHSGDATVVWMGCVVLGLLTIVASAWLSATELSPRSPAAASSDAVMRQREIAEAFEIERHRIERDLHDGAQQYFVATAMNIGEAQLYASTHYPDDADLASFLSSASASAREGLKVLRTTVAGIHPKQILDLGLEEALRDVAERQGLNLLISVPYPLPSLTEGVLAAAYFCGAEALTNVSKYAPQAKVSMTIIADSSLRMSIVDSGPGGAVITPNGGLAGIRDRLAAFGGTMRLSSPPGGPTELAFSIPLLLLPGEPGIGGLHLADAPRAGGPSAGAPSSPEAS